MSHLYESGAQASHKKHYNYCLINLSPITTELYHHIDSPDSLVVTIPDRVILVLTLTILAYSFYIKVPNKSGENLTLRCDFICLFICLSVTEVQWLFLLLYLRLRYNKICLSILHQEHIESRSCPKKG